jgi:hypothetical protein
MRTIITDNFCSTTFEIFKFFLEKGKNSDLFNVQKPSDDPWGHFEWNNFAKLVFFSLKNKITTKFQR